MPPGKLIRKSRDPMGKGRGAGMYYKRVYKGRTWWSKYTEHTDAVEYHKRKKPGQVGMRKDASVLDAEKQFPHRGDYKTKRSKRRKSTRLGTGPRGYF
jgi:hypothetical protein